jgi:NADPH:quinone reductase-like Zn-dependent oxidoreductase
MNLRNRIFAAILALLTLGIVSLAVALSYESPCVEPEALPAGKERMQGVVRRCYGTADVLKIEEIEKPEVAGNELLIKVQSAAVNPLDYHYMTGIPYVMRLSSGFGTPSRQRLGVDFSGTVEAVGSDVTRFKPGDEILGTRSGALAEYVTVPEDGSITSKPANLTFDQAAAIPIAAVTALQGLRDKGRIQQGQKVLINGASGGVGTFAVQLAKSFGAEVTGVCSTRNVEMVRSLGADHVIDYTRENFTDNAERYDLILDNVGNHPLLDVKRALKPRGLVVIVGGPKNNRWIGPLGRSARAMMLNPFIDEEFVGLMASMNPTDLDTLAELARAGKVTPVIDRRYALDETAEAIRYLEQGRARGKVIVAIGGR